MRNKLFVLIALIFSFSALRAQWPLNNISPVSLANYPKSEFDPAYTWDESGNSFYLWTDFRNNKGELYLQKLNKYGEPQYRQNGLKIGDVTGDMNYTLTRKDILPLANGGVLVAWHAIENSANSNSKTVRVNLVLPNGTVHSENGIKISQNNVISEDVNTTLLCLAALDQTRFSLVYNAYSGVGNDPIMFSGFNFDDNAISQKTLTQNPQEDSKAVFDQKNKRFVLLSKQSGNEDYKASAYDLEGNELIASKSFLNNPFAGSSRIDYIRNINGQTVIGRTLDGGGKKRVIAQRLDENLNNVWNGAVFGSDAGYDLQVYLNQDGGGTMAWIEPNSFQKRMMAARIDGVGNTLWEKPVFNGIEGVNYFSPNKFASDGQGGAYSLWFTPKSTGFDLSLQHLDQNGNQLWGDAGLSIKDFNWYGVYRLLAHPENGVIVYYSGTKDADINAISYDLYTNYISPEGFWGIEEAKNFNVNLPKVVFCAGESLGNLNLPSTATAQLIRNGAASALSKVNGEFKLPETLTGIDYQLVFVNDQSISDTISIKVGEAIKAEVRENVMAYEGQSIKLSASGGTIYNWTGPLGFTSNEQNPEIMNATQQMSGLYTVSISNEFGCQTNGQTMVNVEKVLGVFEPKTGSVFPNPSQDFVKVNLAAKISSVHAISTSGIRSSLPFTADQVIDLRQLSEGVFVLQVIDEEKVAHFYKVVKF